MKIVVVSPKVPSKIKELINLEDKIVYAVDAAVSALIKQEVKIDLAIGDFDSLKNKDLLKDLKTVVLNKEKDYSDTAYAIKEAYKKTNDVILIGGLHSKRIDHLAANLMWLSQYPTLKIIDNNNIIERYDTGIHYIKKENYKYMSIFPITDAIIDIENTFYTLKNKDLYRFNTLGLSNVIIKKQAKLTIHKGVLLVIRTK